VFKIKTARDLSLKEIQQYRESYKEQKKERSKATTEISSSMVRSKEGSRNIVPGISGKKVVIFGSLRKY